MIYFSKQNINELGRIPRLQLINSITGFKPANLIGTVNHAGQTNLAIISSVVHMGSDPAILGFFMRPMVTERHTMENILETGCYTINHINSDIAERAHYTSADFARNISEFDKCRLTPVYKDGFNAPYVQESKVHLGMEFTEKIDIPVNGTMLVIGYVTHIYLEENIYKEGETLNLAAADTICISGLDTYHKTEPFAVYPFARPENTPDFK